MFKFKKFKALLLIIFGLFITVALISCNSKSGVEGSLTALERTTRITVKATFGTNKNLENGDAVPHIKQYKYDDDSSEYVYDNKDVELSFSNDVYTSASETFTGLTPDTKYLYRLYVTYKSKDKKIAEIECKTKANDETTKISSVEEFYMMEDDPSADYELTADLDFDDSYNSIFNSSSSKQFKGTFNGNGHTISNISFTSDSQIGIFSYCNEAVIYNLNIENVKGDFTSGRASVDMGAVCGKAINTILYNVNVKNVDFDIQGNSTATINVAALVGLSQGSSIVNCKADGVDIAFTRLRSKVSLGAICGQAVGSSDLTLDKIKEEINSTDENVVKYFDDAVEREATTNASKYYILAYDTEAINTNLSGVLYYLTRNESYDAFSHVGGFIGDVSTKDIVYDCYTDCDIEITESESSSNDNEFSLAVGGFFGINYTGTVNAENCLAVASIMVYAGSKPSDDLTDAEKELAYEKLMSNPLCNSFDTDSKTSKDDDAEEVVVQLALIGGFIGGINEYPCRLSNCIFKPGYGFDVYASQFRKATTTEYNYISENYDLASVVDTIITVNGIDYKIEKADSTYYELDATEKTLTEDTYEANMYYTLSADTYTLAIGEFDSTETYYELAIEQVTVSETTFDSTKHYIKNSDSYTLANEFETNYEIFAKYLFADELIGYSAVDASRQDRYDTGVELYSDSADYSSYGKNIYEYLNSLK